MANIVLPVDFSDTIDKLIEGAVKFAKHCDAKIYLIHVASVDIGYAIGDLGFQYFPEIQQAEMEEELKQLNELEQKVKSYGVPCEHILRQGLPAETVLDYAKEKEADYIVMGSHGRSGFYDVFVGSLTKDLTKRSKIPVVVIPCSK